MNELLPNVDRLVRLASAIVDGKQVAPAVYTDHVVVHASNLHQVYPATIDEWSRVTQ